MYSYIFLFHKTKTTLNTWADGMSSRHAVHGPTVCHQDTLWSSQEPHGYVWSFFPTTRINNDKAHTGMNLRR